MAERGYNKANKISRAQAEMARKVAGKRGGSRSSAGLPVLQHQKLNHHKPLPGK